MPETLLENRKWFHRWMTRYIVAEWLHVEFTVGARGKNRERNIALVFQPFEHTNTFSPDSFGTPRLPPFYHIRWMTNIAGGYVKHVYIYYIWNDLTVSRKTENSCITLFRVSFIVVRSSILPQTLDWNIM